MIPLKDDTRLGRVPAVTIALILANVVVYLLASAHGGSIITGPTNETLGRYGAIPYEFSHFGQHCALGLSGLGQRVLCTGQAGVAGVAGPQPATWVTAFTSLFLSANLLVLAVNVLFLAVFAVSLEGSLGAVRLACLYLLGGLAALGLEVVFAWHSVDPTIGAAGAIAAVLGAYLRLRPRGRILSVVVLPFVFTIIELPAWMIVVAWFVIEAILRDLGLLAPYGSGAGIAYYAGGFAFGLLALGVLLPRHAALLPSRLARYGTERRAPPTR